MAGGERMRMSKLDDYTLRLTFADTAPVTDAYLAEAVLDRRLEHEHPADVLLASTIQRRLIALVGMPALPEPPTDDADERQDRE